MQHLHTAREVRMHENHLFRTRDKRIIPDEEETEAEEEAEETLLNSLLKVLNHRASEERRFKRKTQRNQMKSQLLKAIEVLDAEKGEKDEQHWYKNHKKVMDYLRAILEDRAQEKKSYGDDVLSSNIDSNDEDSRGNGSYPDPLFGQQWHLHGSPQVDINVLPVWRSGITGRGIQIAIVDDGLDTEHPDLKFNFAPEASYDYNEHKENPDPNPKDEYNSHGTSAAAVAGAGTNTFCGIGVAPNSRIAGIRMVAAPVSDHEEAEGLVHRIDVNHIFSSSWGPTDDGQRMEGPSRLTQLAIKEGVTKGRNGLGTVYVWAGGNGALRGDNCNYDGFANNRFALSIGAITNNGRHAAYSEPCAALDAVTPSSGGEKDIVTTALAVLGNGCTSSFGGTSASSPMAAGIVALILEANNKLTWRDVQGVVHLSSKKVDETDEDWKQNGAGLWVNHKYGFGLMDAEAAVKLAKTWINYPAELPPIDSGVLSGAAGITTKEFSYEVKDDITVLHVEIKFDASIHARGDLSVVLYSPSGLPSTLHEYHEDGNPNVVAWTYTSKRYWHESSKGTWKLAVNSKSKSPFSVNSWGLKIYGHNKSRK
eukprot:TRINITY_DN84_c0_g1_i2.p1 TRINITY_DN84_c0_g1~~TRINITY_DN84_c0_g1_i2.p1  ORF type:complete len:593 (+),score=138.18 TRINITY_DN84_c0_g1_i2:315-2093(+)